ncbi:hypothetical protein ISCGN_002806 [Ixodes scapularis]
MNKPAARLCASYYVCSDHFTVHDFMDPGRARLTKTAVPSVRPLEHWQSVICRDLAEASTSHSAPSDSQPVTLFRAAHDLVQASASYGTPSDLSPVTSFSSATSESAEASTWVPQDLEILVATSLDSIFFCGLGRTMGERCGHGHTSTECVQRSYYAAATQQLRETRRLSPSPLTPTETSVGSQTPEAPQKLTKSKAFPQRLAPKVRVVLDPTRSQVRKGSPPSSAQGVEEAMEVNVPFTEGSMETATPVPSCSKAGNVSSAPQKKSAQASQVPAGSSGRGRAQPTRLTDNARKPGHSDEAVSLRGPEVSTEEKMEEAGLASDDDLLPSGAESLSSSAAWSVFSTKKMSVSQEGVADSKTAQENLMKTVFTR